MTNVAQISKTFMNNSNSLCMFRRFLLAKTDTPPDVKPRYTIPNRIALIVSLRAVVNKNNGDL